MRSVLVAGLLTLGLIARGPQVIIRLPAPVLVSLSVSSGAVGSSVTLTGTSFGGKGNGTVTFNGVLATVTSWTQTAITVTVPVGATTGPVVVHQNNFVSTGLTFTVTSGAPTNPIAPSRQIDWTLAGTTIATRSRCTTGTGTSVLTAPTTVAAINTAISGCDANHRVELAAGTYTLSGQILMKSNVSLVGAGAQSGGTYLIMTNPAACAAIGAFICFNGGDGHTWPESDGGATTSTWTAGYTRGTTSLTIGPLLVGTQRPLIGSMIGLESAPDATTLAGDTFPDFFFCADPVGASCTQVPSGERYRTFARVTNITGTSTCSANCTVTITPPLAFDFRSANAPKAWWPTVAALTGAGLEDLRLSKDPTCDVESGGMNICPAYPAVGGMWTMDSWMKSVQIDGDFTARMTFFEQAIGLTVRSNYFFRVASVYADTYGWDCYACAFVRVENNLVQRVRTPIVSEEGSVGGVYLNNYTVNDYDATQDFHIGAFVPHGFAAYNLIEGNDTMSAKQEHYFATSLFVTMFRNRLYGQDQNSPPRTAQTNPVALEALVRHANLVGNVLGTAGYHTVYEAYTGDGHNDVNDWQNYVRFAVYCMGSGGNCAFANGQGTNDTQTRPTAFRWGNWDVVSGLGHTTDTNDQLGVHWLTTEVPTGLALYANPVPSTQTLPASLVLVSKPAYWGASDPWPAIGPDVTNGTLPNSGGHAYKNPAHKCWDTMGGAYSDTAPKNFTPVTCYGTP